MSEAEFMEWLVETMEYYEHFISFMKFHDPATAFCINLMVLHNYIMGYMVFILTFVYWSIYKIAQEFIYYNKEEDTIKRTIYWDTFQTKFERIFFVFFVYKRWLEAINFWMTHQERKKERFYFKLQYLFLAVFGHLKFPKLWAFGLEKEIFKEPKLAKYYRPWYVSKIWRDIHVIMNHDYYNVVGNKELQHIFIKYKGRWKIEGLNTLWLNDMDVNGEHFAESFSRIGYYFDEKEEFNWKEFIANQKYRHSVFLEMLWATVPSLIIFVILIPSGLVLYSINERLPGVDEEEAKDGFIYVDEDSKEEIIPDYMVKIIGHQWYWEYEVNDVLRHKTEEFVEKTFEGVVNENADSILTLEEDLKEGEKRLLEVDNMLILPTNHPIKFLITSGDVLHSFSIPEFGLKADAIPGRLNFFRATILRPGIFYGQCSELCGVGHAFMPIKVAALSKDRMLFPIISAYKESLLIDKS